MSAKVLAVALLAGLANYAFRVLPMYLPALRSPPRGLLGRFLSATGPAAIATLMSASLLPMLSAAPSGLAPVVAGVMSVVAIWLWRRSVALSTLGGAIAYATTVALVA